jgi:hypothetical protein
MMLASTFNESETRSRFDTTFQLTVVRFSRYSIDSIPEKFGSDFFISMHQRTSSGFFILLNFVYVQIFVIGILMSKHRKHVFA